MPDETKPDSKEIAVAGPPPTLEELKYKEELAKQMGLPSTYGMGLMKQLSTDLINSGFAPACFKNNPMALFLAAMRGREMGISPMEAILETFWAAPGGKLGMYANKMLQLLHRQGVTSKFLREDADGCEILFTPQEPYTPYTATFYKEEAKAAGLVRPDSNWVKWPADMCKARAISRGWRALAGVVQGAEAMYSKEELEDFPDSTATDADQKRADVLEAKEEAQFQVGRKKKEPVVVVAAKGDEPELPALGYSIYRVTNGMLVLENGEPLNQRLGEAEMRAQALANQHRVTFVVKDGKTMDEVARKEPPTVIAETATKPTAAPVSIFPAAAKPKATPKPRTAKHPLTEDFKLWSWTEPTQEAAKVLYDVLGCHNAEDFRKYAEATDLDNLQNLEARSFCQIAARIIDTSRLVKVITEHKADGVSYEQFVRFAEESAKAPIETIAPEIIRSMVDAAVRQFQPDDEEFTLKGPQ